MSSGVRAILIGLLIGLVPVVLIVLTTGGFSPTRVDTLADLDPAYVDEQLAAYDLTPTAERGRAGINTRKRPVFDSATPTPAAATDQLLPPVSLPDQGAASPMRPSTQGTYPAAEWSTWPAIPSTRLGAAVPSIVRRWEGPLVTAAISRGVDVNLLAALVMTESGGNPDAISSQGAVGLLQVIGGSRDPAQNLDQGAAILAGHLSRFRRVDLALAAYNAGASAVEQYGGVPPFRETRDHVFRVLVRFDLYSR